MPFSPPSPFLSLPLTSSLPSPLNDSFHIILVDLFHCQTMGGILRMILRLVLCIAITSVVCCETSDASRLRRSLEYFEEANLLYGEEKYELALAFYRAALRLSPEYALFLEKTAALELQMNNFKKWRRLHNKLQSMGLVGVPNIADTETEGAPDPNTKSCDKHPQYRIELVDELSVDTLIQCGTFCYAFDNFDMISMKPFVLRNATGLMRWNTSSLDATSLIRQHGSNLVDFYPQNLLAKPKKVYHKSIADVLDYIEYPDGAYLSVDASQPGAYAQWNINASIWSDILEQSSITVPRGLDKDMMAAPSSRRPAHCSSSATQHQVRETDNDKPTQLCADAFPVDFSRYQTAIDNFYKQTHWHMILIGEQGAGMFLHQDILPVGSWQAQVTGAKAWTLCPPLPPSMQSTDGSGSNGASVRGSDDQSVAYSIPQTATLSNEVERLVSTATDEIESAIHNSTGPKDFADCPESFPVTCSTIEVHPGDLIYYPPHYWHSTVNLASPSISVSSTVLLEAYEKDFYQFVRNECSSASSHHKIRPHHFMLTADFCEYLEVLYGRGVNNE